MEALKALFDQFNSVIESLRQQLADTQAAVAQVADQAKEAVRAELQPVIDALNVAVSEKDQAIVIKDAQLVDKDNKIAELQAALDEANANPKPDPSKIYSQDELDAQVESAREAIRQEMRPQIDELQAKVDGIDAKVNEAVAAMKADLLEKFRAQQASESASESDFEEHLK